MTKETQARASIPSRKKDTKVHQRSNVIEASPIPFPSRLPPMLEKTPIRTTQRKTVDAMYPSEP